MLACTWFDEGWHSTYYIHLCKVSRNLVHGQNHRVESFVSPQVFEHHNKGSCVTFLDYFYAYYMQTIIGTASYLYLNPFTRC